MIFSPELLPKVLDGTKTQTRRPVKPLDLDLTTAVGNAGRLRWRVGQSLAVQTGRGKPAVARVEVLSVQRARLQDVSDIQAMAEGFGDREEFLRFFAGLYPDEPPNPEVWVLTFRLVEQESPSRFLRFEWTTPERKRTRVGYVFSKRTGVPLGEMAWYGRWHQYVLAPWRQSILNAQCLRDIAAELDRAMAEHRPKRR